LASTKINGESTNRSIAKSTEKGINISFTFDKTPVGDSIYVERYYNNEHLDTTILDMVEDVAANPTSSSNKLSFNLNAVGLYEFIIRDLAGRVHKFNIDNINTTPALQVYLINEILYSVNGKTPLNNQVFNDSVEIVITSELDGLTLYNASSIGIKATRNGKDYDASTLKFNDPGYYTITMVATTIISDGSANVVSQEISSSYSFVILKTNVAQSNFSVSKGKGLQLEKIIKTSNSETYDVTEEYNNYLKNNASMNTNTLWLTFDPKYENSKIFGNATYTVTLKAYNKVTQSYEPFTFNVWINNETPTIISNIPHGSSSNDVITIDYNPGLIYSQVGKCYIQLNDNTVITVDETSELSVQTLSITTKGTYWLKIVSEDGSIISSYKFTKTEPLNGITIIIISISVGGVLLLVGIFFFIRRKGKYR